MNDFFWVQVVQTNQYHREVMHRFIFSKCLLFFHQRVKVTFWCKLSDDTELILINELLNHINDKRMRSSLKNFNFPVISQLLQRAHQFLRYFKNLSCACCLLIFGHDLIHSAVRSLTKFLLISKLQQVCTCSLGRFVTHFITFWKNINYTLV